MTRGERDYNKGKIYELVCNITGERYVGSTCKDYLSQRRVGHKSDLKRWKAGKISFTTSSLQIVERGDYDMILLENFPCQSKDQLHTRERYWIELTDKCVNKARPVITKEEREQYQRDYHEQNKEKLKEQQQRYNQENKERRSEWNKQYCEANREKVLENKRRYYEEHTEEKKEYDRKRREQRVVCECGAEVSRASVSNHRKTKKHQDLLQVKH